MITLAIISFTSIKKEIKEIKEVTSMQRVTCMDDYGNMGVFEISIPIGVRNSEAYIKGFCKSVM
jgi:hypothetical protein